MIQPTKKSGTYQKPRSKTVKKSNSPTSAKNKKKYTVEDMIKKNIAKSKKPHPKYGTSKLEDKFAKEFLDKLNITYIRQYEAKDIKRFYDFALTTPQGSMVLLEIDGDYW